MKTDLYQARFSLIYELTSKQKLFLLKRFHSEEEIFHLDRKEIESVRELTALSRKALWDAIADDVKWKASLDKVQQERMSIVFYGDSHYPKRLYGIADPPYCLFVKGKLPEEERKAVAIVGARGSSPYGETVAAALATELAHTGIHVISGMAAGIDGASHRGALEGHGTTYAVLGCGADICYPAGHRRLYHELIDTGGILTEYPPGTPPKALHFPMRNRLISGLCDVLVVVEAKKKSGSLITADFALEQGKPVYAVPGRLTDALSAGTNWLIAQGANPLYSIEEFLLDLKINQTIAGDEALFTESSLAKEERLVYSVLDFTPKYLETIIDETAMGFSDVIKVLYTLLECGCVKEVYKNYFSRASL